MNEKFISRVSFSNYLGNVGIHITDNLSWNDHCSNICKKANSREFNPWSAQTNLDQSYLAATRRSKVQLTLPLFALNWNMLAEYGIPTSSVISMRLRWFNVVRCLMIIPVLIMFL